MPLNAVIIVPPLRKKVSFYPPFGAMSIIASARQDGHTLRLLDLDASRCDDNTAIDLITGSSPAVIGISAVVSTSYSYVKRISALIRKKMPGVLIVVGGGLSAAGEVVLRHTDVDILVHGEGEITFRELLNKIESNGKLDDVAGISFKRDNVIIKNAPGKIIRNLDDLPFPDYDCLDLSKYILNINDFIKGYGNPENIDKRLFSPARSTNFMRVFTGRGCISRCTFCYRNVPGLRLHSFAYIGNMIEHVVSKYDLGHISFADECFGPTKKWLWDFIEMVKKRKFDLTYHITGMRVDSVDMDLLKALKEIGVWHIQFGFESGSQKILNVMEKRTTVEQNIKVVRMMKEAGLNTIPFIIIGYPGETPETISETISFLKNADLMSRQFRPNFPMAMPGTPLYEYAVLKGFIKDEDKYLEAISDVEAAELSKDNYFINYTESPTDVVMNWMAVFHHEIIRHMGTNTFSGIIKKIFGKFRNKGLREVVFLAIRRITAKYERHRLQNVFNQKDNGGVENVRAASRSGSFPEILPEGESLRIINKRLKDSRIKAAG
ncbi:MAG: radical SAM protein [Candidatus Omnitrophota bacterium]